MSLELILTGGGVCGSEAGAVQRPFIRNAGEAGWTYLTPDEALRLRSGGVISPVLVFFVNGVPVLAAGVALEPRGVWESFSCQPRRRS